MIKTEVVTKSIRVLLLCSIIYFLFGCSSKITSDHTPYPQEGVGELMYVPQLSKKWVDSLKIVGDDESEFLSDFLLIQDKQQRWHCIGIGGQGHIQDSFFHAVSDDLLSHFTYTTRVESNGVKPLSGMAWMWAPYAIYDGDKAYMYYCHVLQGTEQAQMRVLQSTDSTLDTWVKAKREEWKEGNIAFTEGGDRDACIFFDENSLEYFMYYSGTNPNKNESSINLRTSTDLINWSDPTAVMEVPEGYGAAESPFVIKRFGYYYLFVSGFDYGRVAVYASKDPFNFGHPNDDKLGEINGHAPEIVSHEGRDYIACAAIWQRYSGSKDYTILSGVYLQELEWVEKENATWLVNIN